MQVSLLLLNQVFAQFLMILIGFVLIKCKVMQEKDAKVISTMTLYTVCTCAIVNAFMIDFSVEKLQGFLLSLAAGALIHILFIAISMILKPILKLDVVEQVSLVYANCGNLVLPLVTAVFGDEYLIYACGYMFVNTVLIYTHCATLVSGRNVSDIKKILLNPNVIAMYIGIFLFVTQLKLPKPATTVVSSFASMLAPLSMIVIGMALGKVNFLKLFTTARNYLILFIRLIAMPMIVILIIKITGAAYIISEGKTVLFISLLGAASCPAALITQFAQFYDRDASKAGALNIMAIIFLMITLPLVTMFYQWFV